MSLIPFVIEPTMRGERSYDIFSRLLSDRIIFLDTHVDPIPTSIIIAQLLYLESQAPDKDINLYINSPGGSVIDGFAIIDAMNHIKCDVSTICIGTAASMAAVILSCGAVGKRFALPLSEIMIHQPLSSLGRSQITDIEIHVDRMRELKYMLTDILAKNCGKSYDEMAQFMDRDNFMSAQRALEFGIIDKIL